MVIDDDCLGKGIYNVRKRHPQKPSLAQHVSRVSKRSCTKKEVDFVSAYFMYSSMCISYRSTAITAASRPAVEPGVTVKLQGQGFCGRVLDDQ